MTLSLYFLSISLLSKRVGFKITVVTTTCTLDLDNESSARALAGNLFDTIKELIGAYEWTAIDTSN